MLSTTRKRFLIAMNSTNRDHVAKRITDLDSDSQVTKLENPCNLIATTYLTKGSIDDIAGVAHVILMKENQ